MSRTIKGLTGTVSATQYSATLTGVSTDWDSTLEGKYIKIGVNGKRYTINKVNSTTSMELTRRYQEPTCSGEYFEILENRMFVQPNLIQDPVSTPTSDPNVAGRFPDYDETT
jgi:hypothetical protein